MRKHLIQSDMRDYLTPDDIASEIRLLRDQFKGAFLIVEGDTDQRFYGGFVEKNSCQIIAAHNKQNAVKVLEILEKAEFNGVLGIVDADFWRLDGRSHSENLFLTDTHDLETMILNSPALEKVTKWIGSTDKVKKLTIKKDVRQILLDAGAPIGYLRWISEKEGFNLKFEDLNFGNFVDERTLIINISAMIIAVTNKSQKQYLNTKDLRESIEESTSHNHNPWDVCCGHDLVCILSLGFRKALGSHNAQDVNPNSIEERLILAYEEKYFLMTNLYKSLKAWEENNGEFRLFIC